ncbi:PKD domain-containing protein [Pedobacter nanyangensis]|uniref:PKD domain-containing protein n=1 Tax=Pedobacter nanyangensis TaxID=1562389 RepID=UPI000DE4336D|nr:PKD domain-containing protein [Pedobacter nanyangensis]
MKNRLLLAILFLSLLCFNISLQAQSTSNRGTDFWLAYTGHVDGLVSRMTLFLSSDVNTTYEVKSGGRTIASGTIVANVVTPVFINPNQHNVYIGSSNKKELDKGINISSAKPISLYCVISNNARTGSTLVLPTATLEQEYYVFSEQNKALTGQPVYSQFAIVGTKDGTVVDITPTQESTDGLRTANAKFQITLNKGDVYQYQSIYDLTGTLIKAVSGCTPIAVFSGTTWAAFCELGNLRSPSGGDNLFQQMFPVTAWGRNFVSAPFYNTLNGNTDIIKIIVAEDNTTVNVNGSTTMASGTPLLNPYKKGSVITFYTASPNVIKASSAIAVAQYQTSQTCNLANNAQSQLGGPFLGDPEMTILNPIEQTLKDIAVYSRLNSVQGVNTNISKYFLNIIIKTADIQGFTLDGGTISSQFKPVANSEYSYAVVDVTNAGDQHRLIANGGFVAIAYGYGSVESYAYLAGTDLKNLKSNIQVFPAGGSIASNNFCLGTNLDFVLKLPYITDKLTWNFNNGAITEVVTTPSYTTHVEDGQTYYLYKYVIPQASFNHAGHYVLKVLIQKPALAICAVDEDIFTTFDVFFPEINAPAQACIRTDIQFTDVSPKTGGNISAWEWDFGDGTKSTLQNPVHKYATYGTKTVKLKVLTDMGCNLFATKNIDVIVAPKADFNAIGPFCIDSDIKFSNQTTSVNSNVASQTWNFGNGQPESSEYAPSTRYKAAGNYQVKLISVSSSGCADTVMKTITIAENPEITFKDPGSCVNDIVQFEATAVKGNFVTWQWDFGDGNKDLLQDIKQRPTHKFQAAGTYHITLSGTTDQGCSAVFTQQVTISGANPAAGFEVKNGIASCANNEVSFENKSSIPFGKISKIEWIFDYENGGPNIVVTDDNPSLGKIYTHKYPNLAVKKDYKVVMRAYSGKLCFTESELVTVSIYPVPVLKVEEVSPLCETSDPVQLTVTDEHAVAGSFRYSGTGVSSTGVFSPRISGAGNFNVKYVFTTNEGCIEEKNINVIVNKLPKITLPPGIDILLGGQKLIEAAATGTNIKYKWSPSEGLSADNVLNPIANPTKTTRYTLTVTSNACQLVYEYLVNVHENPSIPNVFSPNGDGKNDTWNIKYLETFEQGTINIFNRYGQKVFEASPYNTPWDGKLNGTDLPVGVYYYIIEPNNGRKKYTGSVTILR